MSRTRAFLLVALTTACAAPAAVTRVADGAREQGPYIEPEAYSTYAQAALLEAAGDSAGALRAYHAALDSDADSADIRTRIGALQCRVAKDRKPSATSAGAAFDSFEDALDRDPTYSAAYAARARCLASLGQLKRALADAQKAVRYDPDRIELTELVTRLLLSLGRKEEAWTWLDALVTRQPNSPQAWRLYRTTAELDRDTVRLRRASMAEQDLGLGAANAAGTAALNSDAIDALLRARDLEGARRAALTQRWRPAELAVRAAELGALAVAAEQARFVLAADPSDSDAWIVLLVTTEQAHDPAAFDAVLAELAPDPLSPSPRAVELMAGLLERHVGDEAARALRASFSQPQPASAQ